MNNRRKLLAREMKHSFHKISALYESRNKRKLICDGRSQAFIEGLSVMAVEMFDIDAQNAVLYDSVWDKEKGVVIFKLGK